MPAQDPNSPSGKGDKEKEAITVDSLSLSPDKEGGKKEGKKEEKKSK